MCPPVNTRDSVVFAPPDMTYSARQIQKNESKIFPIYQVFVELNKTYNTVNRDAMWRALGKLESPHTFINMFKELHRSMKASVTFTGKLLDEIAMDNGVN